MRNCGIFLFAAGLALAGCSRHDNREEVTEGMEQGAVATSAASDAPSAEAVPKPAATTLAGSIPAGLRGRWGLVPADCTSTHGDAKGLMEVGATTLTFYESRAKLGQVRESSAERIRAEYSFNGEGQEWTQDVELRSWEGGAKLIREDRGPDALPGPLTYTRCPR